MRIPVLLIASPLLLSGCITTGISRKGIERAEASWNAQQLTDYQYDVHLDAFVPRSECLDDKFTLTVVVRDSKTASFGTCAEPPDREAAQASIPALFAMAKAMKAESIASLKMKFDSALKYPTVIEIVTSRWMTDSTFIYKVSNFKSLTPLVNDRSKNVCVGPSAAPSTGRCE